MAPAGLLGGRYKLLIRWGANRSFFEEQILTLVNVFSSSPFFLVSRHPIVFTKEPQNPVPQAEREDASNVKKSEMSVVSSL